MLDFLRDTYLELSGIDSSLAEKERKEKAKLKKEKEKKIIIPKYAKKIISIFIVLYLISCLGTFQIILKSENIMLIIRSAVQILDAILVIVFINIKNKKTELIGIGLIVLFFVLQYMGIVIFSI